MHEAQLLLNAAFRSSSSRRAEHRCFSAQLLFIARRRARAQRPLCGGE